MNKRLEEDGVLKNGQSEVNVRLSGELRGLFGGRKYVKAKDLTREILLEYAKRQGAVTEVDLLSVTVQSMGGTELEVKLDESQNTAEWLKRAIQDEQGISVCTQQLFLVSKKGGDDNTAGASGGAEEKQEPLKDDELVSDSSIVALCVDFSAALNEWDSSSPLISNKLFVLSGDGNSIATQIDDDQSHGGSFDNCLWTARVMESGKHRISLKLMAGERGYLDLYFGLVRDGVAWDRRLHGKTSTDAWYMTSGNGDLCGNGKYRQDSAGRINEGQIVSMEADLDKGTLRFWVDGKPHGPGHSSGVTGRLRWAVCLAYQGNSVQIVPTPELQPWTWVPPVRD